MTDKKEHLSFWNNSVTIPFIKDSGYLGAGTNGAMPQKAFGIWIEAEIGENIVPRNDEPYENLWVKIAVDEEQVAKRDTGEYLMYGDLASVEKVLSAMMTANLHQTEVRLKGKFDAYMNRAQIDFDGENATEECIDGLEVVVVPGKAGGVDVSFYEPKAKPNHWFKGSQVVARLNADVSREGWALLATEFRKLRVWREECLNEIAKAVRERQQDAAPTAPGM